MLSTNSSVSNTNSIDGKLNSYINNLNINELTKEQLISLIKYINSICKETLPVKCILLLLKTVLRNVDCELVEFCQLDDNNLIVNYMLKDVFMLHKNVINHSSVDNNNPNKSNSNVDNTNKDNMTNNNTDSSENNVYYYVFSTNSNNILVIDDIDEYNNNNVYKYHNNLNASNNSSNVTPSNMILIPMSNTNNNTWAVLSIINYKFNLTQVETIEEDYDLGNSLSRLNLTGLNSSSGNCELRYIYELCYISGIIINNVIEKLELESNKNKSNSLITLMHSLFSDQLSIQSCLISLTTHAKKLIQVENCTVYLFNKSKNQLLSISSNTCVQSILTLSNHSSVDSNNLKRNTNTNLDNGNFVSGNNNNLNNGDITENNSIDVLSYCVNTSNTIIYDSNYNNNINNNNNLNKSNNDVDSGRNNVVVINSLSQLPFLNYAVNGNFVSGNNNNLNNSNNLNKSNADRENSISTNSSVELNNGTSEMNNIRNGIWIPIKNDNNVVLAIIEVINKQAQELLHFTEDDLNLLELFAVIVGPQFERSEFNSIHLNKNTTEAGLAFDNNYLNNSNLTNTNIKNFIEQSIIEEEEDDNIE